MDTHTTPAEPQGSEHKAETRESGMAPLKEKLKQHLEGARVRLEEVKRAISSLREGDRGALEQRSDEVHKRVDAQQERADELRTQKASHAHDKPVATDEPAVRDRGQLQLEADHAEECAINAVMVAMMDADEVEVAVLEALIAREVLEDYLETEGSTETDRPGATT